MVKDFVHSVTCPVQTPMPEAENAQCPDGGGRGPASGSTLASPGSLAQNCLLRSAMAASSPMCLGRSIETHLSSMSELASYRRSRIMPNSISGPWPSCGE